MRLKVSVSDGSKEEVVEVDSWRRMCSTTVFLDMPDGTVQTWEAKEGTYLVVEEL